MEKIEEIQSRNKKCHDQLVKKVFFREFDYMNKEVLVFLLKKLPF